MGHGRRASAAGSAQPPLGLNNAPAPPLPAPPLCPAAWLRRRRRRLQDPDSVANKALKEAARQLERRETLASQDHAVPKGSLAAEAQVRCPQRSGAQRDCRTALGTA